MGGNYGRSFALLLYSRSFVKWRRSSAEITLHSWKELWELPPEDLAKRQKHTSVHFLCLCFPLWCASHWWSKLYSFDVELGDFIVTSLPTRRAVSHWLHLNNPAPLLHSFYKHQSLNTCFHIPADYHTILVGEGCAQIQRQRPHLL